METDGQHPCTAPSGCLAPGCQLLAEKLAKSEQKRQRLRANLQKFRDKLIDTDKLLQLFNEIKQEKEVAERQVATLSSAARELETVRRQQAEDRRKLEEARDQLADKAREVKDLDAINARLRLKVDAAVAEGTQPVTRELERCKKDKQAVQQAKELAERRARQAESRLQAEQVLVAELRQQLRVSQAERSTSAPTAGSSDAAGPVPKLDQAQLNDITAAISAQLQDSLQPIVVAEVKKAVQSPTHTHVGSVQAGKLAASTGQIDALRATMEAGFKDLSAAVQTGARKHSIEQVEQIRESGSDPSATAELLREMHWIRRRITQDGPPYLPTGGVAGQLAAIADAGDPSGIAPSFVQDKKMDSATQSSVFQNLQVKQAVVEQNLEGQTNSGNANDQQGGNEQKHRQNYEHSQSDHLSLQQGAIPSSKQDEEQEEDDAASFALELEEVLSADTDPDTEVCMTDGDNATLHKQSRSTKTTPQRHRQELQQLNERPAHASEPEIDTPRSSKREHQASAAEVTAGTSGTNGHMDRAEFEDRLRGFYTPQEVPSPSSCGERIDLFLLYQLVAELGGPDQTGKLRKWTTVARKLAQSTAGCSDVTVASNAGNIAKANYSKYISPVVEHRVHRSEARHSQIRVEGESEQNLSRKRARIELAPPASIVVAPEVSSIAKLWNTVATCSGSDLSKKLESTLSQFAGQQMRGPTWGMSKSDDQGKYRHCLTDLMKLSSRVAEFRRGSNPECGCDDGVQVCEQVERCLVAAAGPALQALRSWCEAMVLASSESASSRAAGRYTVESVAVVWCDAILNVANIRWGPRPIVQGRAAPSLIPIEDTPSGVACAFLALLCHLLDHSDPSVSTFPSVAAGLSTALLQCLHRRLLSCDPGKEEVAAKHFGYTFGYLCKLRGAIETGRVCLYEVLRHRAGVELAVIDAICAGWPELGPITMTDRGVAAGMNIRDDESPQGNRSKLWLRRTMAWALTFQCTDLSSPDTNHHDRDVHSTDLNPTGMNQARHFWTRLRPTWDLRQTSNGDRTVNSFLDQLLRANLESEPDPAGDCTLDMHLAAGLAGRMKDWMWLYKNWIRPILLPLVTQDFQHLKQGVLSADSLVGNSAHPPTSTKYRLNAIRVLGELAVTIAECAAMRPLSRPKQGQPTGACRPSSVTTRLQLPRSMHVRSASVSRSYTRLSSSDELVEVIVGALAEQVSESRVHVGAHAVTGSTRSNSNGNGHRNNDLESTHRDCACRCGGGCSDATACVMASAATDALARISVALSGVDYASM